MYVSMNNVHRRRIVAVVLYRFVKAIQHGDSTHPGQSLPGQLPQNEYNRQRILLHNFQQRFI